MGIWKKNIVAPQIKMVKKEVGFRIALSVRTRGVFGFFVGKTAFVVMVWFVDFVVFIYHRQGASKELRWRETRGEK